MNGVDLDENIEKINKNITDEIKDFNNSSINNVLHKIEDSKRFEVRLSSDLTIDKLMRTLIKYEYAEQRHIYQRDSLV